jgi:glucoamylase
LTEQALQWNACADRIWDEGIAKEIATKSPASPGLVDPESGRFVYARRLSKLKGFWTNDPQSLIDRPLTLDINMLGLSVPFGLLTACDPRMIRTEEGIVHLNNELHGEKTDLLAGTNFDPSQTNRSGSNRDQHEVSSLATLWMVRFLIQLGRETGQGKHWTKAVSMLDGILGRLSQLGLSIRSGSRGIDSARHLSNPGGTAWRLHAMIIETLLDLAGLDYDAVDRRLTLRPALPGRWPQTGIKQSFVCGSVTYRLERPIGSKVHHLNVRADLKEPIVMVVDLTCPDLTELGPWQSSPTTPEPSLDPRTGKLRWSVTLPADRSEWNWTWG